MPARARRLILGDDRGFTLTELFVVMIVIGILAAIAIPIFLNTQVSAVEASVKSDLVQAKTVMVRQFMSTGTYPADYPSLIAAGFAPETSIPDRYTVTFELSNVSDAGFCIRGWADTDGAGHDLWVSASSGVVGPIPVGDVAGRPDGC
ncbi:MAG TPA: type II secretion system protein [Pseudolysinimonas sp.]